MSTVVGTNLSKLESSYALEIMSNISKYLKYSIQTAPTSPRAGELYLFATRETSKKGNLSIIMFVEFCIYRLTF